MNSSMTLEDAIGDTLVVARERAASRIQQVLQYPEELDNVEQLRMRTISQKLAADTRLKTVLHAQRDDIQTGLNTLDDALKDIESVREHLAAVEDEYAQCVELREYIQEAKELSTKKRNFQGTLEQIDRIFTVPETVEEIKDALNDPGSNLLEIHNSLSELESCQDSLLARMVTFDGGKEVVDVSGQGVVKKYFADVDELAGQLQQKLFVELFPAPGITPLELVQQQPNGATRLVSILRIIEREETLDRRHAESAASNPGSGAGSGSAASSSQGRRPKNLRSKFFQKLEEGVDARFDERLFTHIDSVQLFFNAYDEFYVSDLEVAQEQLDGRFPPDYNIVDTYVGHYHANLCSLMDRLKKNENIQPGEIMVLLRWAPKYEVQMEDKLGVDVADLPQKLLNRKESEGESGEYELRQQYLQMLGGKLASWCTNLIAMEVSPLAANRSADAPLLYTTPYCHVKKGYPNTDGVDVVLSANRLAAKRFRWSRGLRSPTRKTRRSPSCRSATGRTSSTRTRPRTSSR